MAGSGPVPPRWVVVIPRNQPELFESLRRSLIENAPFRVILDRRERERRRGGGAADGNERRRADRRQRAPVGSFYVAAFTAVESTPRAALPSAGHPSDSPVVTTACPACWVGLTFELPRFPRPPARLEADVVHVGGPKSAQHYAEIQAFTISGRPLLVQRVQAFRQTSDA